MINFDTNNLIIVAYPPMAGGKFLINCLALSSDAVFQHRIFAQQDLNNELTSENKMQILRDRLSEVTHWNDLYMGCRELFGVDEKIYEKYNGNLSIFRFNDVIETLSNSKKLFFIVAHTTTVLTCILKVWRNARVIMFTDCLPFINMRGGNNIAADYWKDIRATTWPDQSPKTYKELMTYPKIIIDNIEKLFPDMYDKLVDNIERYPHDLSKTIFWNNNLYFSSEDTANGVEKLYKEFNLTGYNREYILEYHKLWIEKINQLK